MIDLEAHLAAYGRQLDGELPALQIDGILTGAVTPRPIPHRRPGWAIAAGAFGLALVIGLVMAVLGGRGGEHPDVAARSETPTGGVTLSWVRVQGPHSELPGSGIVAWEGGFAAVERGRFFRSVDGLTWTSEPVGAVIQTSDPAGLRLAAAGDSLLAVDRPGESGRIPLWRTVDTTNWQPVDLAPPDPPPLQGIVWAEPGIDVVEVSAGKLLVVASTWGSVAWGEIYPNAGEFCCVVESGPEEGTGVLRSYAPGPPTTVAQLDIEVSLGDELTITFSEGNRVVHTVQGSYPGIDAANLVEPVLHSLIGYSTVAVSGSGPLEFEPAPWAHPHRWWVDVASVGDGFLVSAPPGSPTTLIDLALPPTEWWMSQEGGTWTEVPSPTVTGEMVVGPKGRLFVPVANAGPLELWTTDGSQWTRLEPGGSVPTGDDLTVTGADFGLVAWRLHPAGDHQNTGTEVLRLWTSGDGTAWVEQEQTFPISPDEPLGVGVTTAGNTVFVVVTEGDTRTVWVGRG